MTPTKPIGATADNMMLVLLRDEDDRGFTVGWSPEWINKCHKDPLMVQATMQAIGTAMTTFAAIMAESEAPTTTPTKGSTAVN